MKRVEKRRKIKIILEKIALLHRIWDYAVYHKKPLFLYYDISKIWRGHVKSHEIRDPKEEPGLLWKDG